MSSGVIPVSDGPGSLAAALAELQTQLPHVAKDAENPHFRSRYATLEGISAALLPLMGKLGLSFSAKPTLDEAGRFVLRYVLRYAPSGEEDGGDYPLGAGNSQQQGSAITYARRYCLQAVTGMAPDEDDDGNAASDAAGNSRKPAKTTSARPRASQATPAQQKAPRASEGPRNLTEQREAQHRRAAEEKARHMGSDGDRGPRPADRANNPEDDIWAMNPEDRPGSLTSGQGRALEALLGQFYGLDSKDREGRHNAVQQLLGLAEPPGSMTLLSYAQADTARKRIVAMMQERELAERQGREPAYYGTDTGEEPPY